MPDEAPTPAASSSSEIPELAVVMPVFNEQASARKVALEFFTEVENWTERFVFLALDDGSTDGTPRVLARLREQLGSRFEIIRHANRGHGQTCLAGYRLAAERGIPFVLQVDSDGQCDPQYFFRFWRLREKADAVYGLRTRRDDGLRRLAASMVLRAFLLVGFGAWCADSNVPYRLLRTAMIAPLLGRISPTFNLANVALALLLRRAPGVRHAYVPIRFRERYGGEPSVKLSLFGRKALELGRELRAMLRGGRSACLDKVPLATDGWCASDSLRQEQSARPQKPVCLFLNKHATMGRPAFLPRAPIARDSFHHFHFAPAHPAVPSEPELELAVWQRVGPAAVVVLLACWTAYSVVASVTVWDS